MRKISALNTTASIISTVVHPCGGVLNNIFIYSNSSSQLHFYCFEMWQVSLKYIMELLSCIRGHSAQRVNGDYNEQFL